MKFASHEITAGIIVALLIVSGFFTVFTGNFLAEASANPIQFDFVSRKSSASTNNSISYSHTVGNGQNRMLVVGFEGEDSSVTDCTALSVTYAGLPLIKINEANVTSSGINCVSLWYLSSPPIGTANVQVTFGGPVSRSASGAISLFNVLQSAPEAQAVNTTIGNSVSASIATLTSGAWLVDAVVSNGKNNFIAGTGQVERYDANPSGMEGAGSTKYVQNPGTTSTSWSNSDNKGKALVVAAFAPALPIPSILNFTANPSSVVSGGTTSITWTSADSTSCTASGHPDWDGPVATSGIDFPVTNITSLTTLTLLCTGPGGDSAPSSVSISIIPPATITSFTANPNPVYIANAYTDISWTSANADSCVASGHPNWNEVKAVSGTNFRVLDVTSDVVFNLVCSGPAGVSATSSIFVAVSTSTAPSPSWGNFESSVCIQDGTASSCGWNGGAQIDAPSSGNLCTAGTNCVQIKNNTPLNSGYSMYAYSIAGSNIDKALWNKNLTTSAVEGDLVEIQFDVHFKSLGNGFITIFDLENGSGSNPGPRIALENRNLQLERQKATGCSGCDILAGISLTANTTYRIKTTLRLSTQNDGWVRFEVWDALGNLLRDSGQMPGFNMGSYGTHDRIQGGNTANSETAEGNPATALEAYYDNFILKINGVLAE